MDTTQVTGLYKATMVECIKKYEDLDTSTKELIEAAMAVRQMAYAPYSKFKVGAAFRSKDGRIFAGCNVENAAFGPTICAERTALTKAVSEGSTEFKAGAVVAYQDGVFTTPCGVCRQFIVEFANEDIPIFVTKAEDNKTKNSTDPVLCTSIYTLLPNGFRNFK